MKKYFFSVLSITSILLLCNSCTKDNSSLGSVYTPTAVDTTANATLQELQLGRTLFIDNCGSCHGLPSPDNYSVSSWKSILSNMVPKTDLSQANAALVTKYVTRGKQ